MNKGKVKWFDQNRGYGFIHPDGGGTDVFVHISDVERIGLSTLEEDQAMYYDSKERQNGKVSAVNLQLV